MNIKLYYTVRGSERDRYKPCYPICISNLYSRLILDYAGDPEGWRGWIKDL
jgi:hypothetical protein